MIQFKGFKPEAMQRIAGSLGYQGNMNGFNDYLNKNPDKMNAMNTYQDKAIQMANGGMIKRNYEPGGYAAPQESADKPMAEFTNIGGGLYSDGTETLSTADYVNQLIVANKVASQENELDTKETSDLTSYVDNTFLNNRPADGVDLTGGFVNTYDPTTGKYMYGSDGNVVAYDTANEYSSAVKANVDMMEKAKTSLEESYSGETLENATAASSALVAENEANLAKTADAARLAEEARKAAELAALKREQLERERLERERLAALAALGGGGGGLNTGLTGEFEGGSLPTETTTLIDGIPQAAAYQGESIAELQANRAINPGLPTGSTVAPVGTTVVDDQLIGDTSGQVTGDIDTPITTAGTTAATGAAPTGANTMTATQISNQVTESLKDVGPAVGVVDPRAEVDAQATTDTSVSGLASAQGTATTMVNPIQRKLETDPVTGESELISGVANAETAAAFSEEIEAATATPSQQATVQGQLEGLMQQFEGGNTPAWAAGSMRAATATMVSRGLGASSMAGQAIIQAAMEAALPIASADAEVYAQFESQNLSNRQQRAMLAAQQRAAFIGQEFDQAFQSRVMNASKVSDIANINFTAEQQVALENSRNANTMNLSNLSNKQAMLMAEAAALSNLDMANLSNRQQAAVMNAQTFLQVDMANLNNLQQTTLFESQQQIQALFTDQAADNASKQFNATSENQTDQFFANLTTHVSQFNAAQSNALDQFNAGQANAQDRFASEMMNQRDQFNAQNRLVIDQQNANWRRQVATADTASINRANEINAASILNMSNTAYNDLWSYYQDSMEYAWNSAESERGRISDMMITKLQVDAAADLSQLKLDYQASAGWGDLMANMFTSPIGGNTILGKGLDAVVDFLT